VKGLPLAGQMVLGLPGAAPRSFWTALWVVGYLWKLVECCWSPGLP